MPRFNRPALLLACAFVLSLGAAHAATFTVTNTNDDTNPGSLREAITTANLDAAADTIKFAIPGAGPHEITLGSDLPNITAPLTIDGYSQSGSKVNTLTEGTNAVLMIRIIGGTNNCFLIENSAEGCVIRGLNIDNADQAINVNEGDDHLFTGCFIGTDIDGNTGLGCGTGITLNNQANTCTIGGTSRADCNIISGSEGGIGISDCDGTVVQGNLIGTNAAGTGSIPNVQGIGMTNATNTLIGGTAKNAGNVISGNTDEGIRDSATSTFSGFNRIMGNRIGTDATGTVALPNQNGISIVDIGLETVGGDSAAARNIISGNTSLGLFIDGATEPASNCIIRNNFIGTDVTGTLAVGNGSGGLRISGAAGADDLIVKDNLISGNGQFGLRAEGTTGLQVVGNLIGTDVTGTEAIANALAGIDLRSNDSSTLIGGDDDDLRNVISGNDGDGISMENGTNTEIYGNFIGTDATGLNALPNGGNGIILTLARDGEIGGSGDLGNVISRNTLNGISISGAGAVDLLVRGNRIGTDPQGVLNLGNGESGIHINNTLPTSLEIGGTSSGEGNIIAFNGADGIAVTGTSAKVEWYGNLIFGNGDIGIDLNDDGATANDGAGDPDGAANATQNFPDITNILAGSPAMAFFDLATTASSTYTAEFFALTSDGRMRFLARLGGLATDGTGVLNGNIIGLGAVGLDEDVVATLIDDTTKNASELSPAVSPGDFSSDSAGLYVKKAKFSVDFAKHAKGQDGDSLSFSGNINPAGIEDFFSSASIDIEVNGQTLLSETLDPSGKNKGTLADGTYTFSIKPSTGAYSFSAKGLDLRTILNVANEDELGTAQVELGLSFTGTSLDTPDINNVLHFDLKSAAGKKAAGKFAFNKNVSVGGAFLSLKTGATEKDPAPLHSVTAKGILTVGDVDPTPNNTIEIEVGSVSVVLGSTDYTIKGSGPQSVITMNKGADPLIAKFEINNAKKTWSLTTNPLDAQLDAIGTGAPNDSLVIRILYTAGLSDVTFRESIEMKRSDINSGKWKR